MRHKLGPGLRRDDGTCASAIAVAFRITLPARPGVAGKRTRKCDVRNRRLMAFSDTMPPSWDRRDAPPIL